MIVRFSKATKDKTLSATMDKLGASPSETIPGYWKTDISSVVELFAIVGLIETTANYCIVRTGHDRYGEDVYCIDIYPLVPDTFRN